jgi:hypothetical protein
MYAISRHVRGARSIKDKKFNLCSKHQWGSKDAAVSCRISLSELSRIRIIVLVNQLSAAVINQLWKASESRVIINPPLVNRGRRANE